MCGRLESTLRGRRPSLQVLIGSTKFNGSKDIRRVLSREFQVRASVISMGYQSLAEVALLYLPFLQTKDEVIGLTSTSTFYPRPCFSMCTTAGSCILDFSESLKRRLEGGKVIIATIYPKPISARFFRFSKGPRGVLGGLAVTGTSEIIRRTLGSYEIKGSISICKVPVGLACLKAGLLPRKFLIHVRRV